MMIFRWPIHHEEPCSISARAPTPCCSSYLLLLCGSKWSPCLQPAEAALGACRSLSSLAICNCRRPKSLDIVSILFIIRISCLDGTCLDGTTPLLLLQLLKLLIASSLQILSSLVVEFCGILRSSLLEGGEGVEGGTRSSLFIQSLLILIKSASGRLGWLDPVVPCCT